jgi:hypothetical protein
MTLKFNEADARALLSSIGQIQLCAIHPNGLSIKGQEFGTDIEAAIAYAKAANENGSNVYWSVNITRPGINSKPAKTDIRGARFCQVDIDPPKSGGKFDKAAIAEGLANYKAPPSFIIDSGGGLNAFWRLDDPYENLQSIEAINRQIRDYCDADHCWNIDRIMRLPGSVNWPDAKKRARGRSPTLAKFAIPDDGTVYEPHALAASFPPEKPFLSDSSAVAQVNIPDNIELLTPDDLGLSVLDETRSAISEPPALDRSGDALAAARLLANAGRTDGEIMGVLLNPANAVSAHCLDQRDTKRAAIRIISRVRADGPASGESLHGHLDNAPTMSAEDLDRLVNNMRAKVKRDMTPRTLTEKKEDEKAEKAPKKSKVPQPVDATGKPKWLADLGNNPIAQFVIHVCDTAASPQPWVTLGAALTVFATAAGRRYASPTNLRTNLYAIGICDSGGGKDHPIKMATELMVQSGQQQRMGGSKIASGQAMLTDLTNNPSLMYAIDEVGFLISSAADRKRAPKHSVDIIDNLTFLYSQAGSTFLGTSYADQSEKGGKPRQVIEQPCLSLFGVTTPNVFWGSLTSSNVMDGSLARMVIFQSANNYPDPQYDIEYREMPQRLIDAIQAIIVGADDHTAMPMGEGATLTPKPYRVPYADDSAKYMARAMRDEQTEMLREHEGTSQTSIIARLAENAVKIALVVAIAENPAKPAITEQHLKWGMMVARQSVDSLLEAIRTSVADNETETQRKLVLKCICDSGPSGCSGTDLNTKTAKIKRHERKSIVEDLVEAQAIYVVEVKRPEGARGPKPYLYFDYQFKAEIEAGGG